MDLDALLSDFKANGVTVTVNNGKLRVSTVGFEICQHDRGLLAEHKPALVKLLSDRQPLTEPIPNADTKAQGQSLASGKHEVSLVECFTPLGVKLIVQANSHDHAKWLQQMNPRPKSVTHEATKAEPKPPPRVICINCRLSQGPEKCGHWWEGHPHTCASFQSTGVDHE
ncbi:MAG: hypothetical protein NTX45_15270 [Proteobacteria bacterium]|nr:hypothetical protein [Pseudomonadota bacterium]